MKKRRYSTVMNIKEFELPIELIQHIQSFIHDEKEKAETCILNKSWFDAWSSRPILNFNQDCFSCSEKDFLNLCRTTMQRYKLLDLKVDSLIFKGRDCLDNHDFSSYYNYITDELVIDALKLGVKEIYLGEDRVLSDVALAQVFASKSLTSLSLWCSSFDQFVVGGCPRLTSLTLNRARFTHQIFLDILLRCPLIENLELFRCTGLTTVALSNIKNLKLIRCTGLTTVDLSKVGRLVNISVCGEDCICFKVYNIGLATGHEFNQLRTLHLYKVNLNNEFFTKFSSKFPCIEELHLKSVRGLEDVQILSNSLRSLNLETGLPLKKVRLDVPKISKFYFGVVKPIPFLSFGTTTSKNWECKVRLWTGHEINEDSWFVELKRFLTELRLSRISLCISVSSECNATTERILCFPIPAVEDLQVDDVYPSAMSLNLLCGLFWSCRPKFISGHYFPEFVYNHLRHTNSKELLCMYNLVWYSLEHKKYLVEAWQPTNYLLQSRNSLKYQHSMDQYRIRLTWGKDVFIG